MGSRTGNAPSSASPGPRRIPRQHRSRAIVQAIVEAGRRLLEEEGPTALTTNRIAERAGVSIGSLYRYFPNKEAVAAAIYESETGREAADLLTATSWSLGELSLRDAVAQMVDFQLARHRRLAELGGDFYLDHHRDFSLARRMGRQLEARIREFLARRTGEVQVGDLDQAAFLVSRGISAVVRLTLDERPEKLGQRSFRDELVDLFLRYLTTPR